MSVDYEIDVENDKQCFICISDTDQIPLICGCLCINLYVHPKCFREYNSKVCVICKEPYTGEITKYLRRYRRIRRDIQTTNRRDNQTTNRRDNIYVKLAMFIITLYICIFIGILIFLATKDPKDRLIIFVLSVFAGIVMTVVSLIGLAMLLDCLYPNE